LGLDRRKKQEELTLLTDQGFHIEVACYAGYRYPERPVSFKLLERSFSVEEILDRWYGEDYFYFKVRADDQRIYLLNYDQYLDQWFLTGMV
jgi:hypothetical protein